MTLTRWYIFSLLIYCHSYLLQISIYLSFIILKLHYFLLHELLFIKLPTLEYKSVLSIQMIWNTLCYEFRGLCILSARVSCVCKTQIKACSRPFQLRLYCALKLRIVVGWSGRSLNWTFYYVREQGELSCIEFFVLSSAACDDWRSTSLLQTCYINSLRRTHSEIGRNSCYFIYSHRIPQLFDAYFLYT